MTPIPVRESTVTFGPGETWYKVTGDLTSTKTPLVVAHGGPGMSHDYVDSIGGIAQFGRAVIHYDQIGGGRSTHLPYQDPSFWTVELFLAELDNLLEHLGIKDNYHLLGQSWGGMLGAEHGVRQPQGLRSLVISNSPASMELWASEAIKLRAQLPPEVDEVLVRHEAAGTYDDPEYVAAAQVYYDRHVCRVVPNPPEVQRTFEFVSQDPTVYMTMNGPVEFYCIGTLSGWTIVDRVHAITAPTLLISGRYDEATPGTVQPYFDNIPDVRWEIFEHSSHTPFIEESQKYLDVVESFLSEHD